MHFWHRASLSSILAVAAAGAGAGPDAASREPRDTLADVATESTVVGRDVLGPADWAERALAPCRASRARAIAAADTLRLQLAALPPSRERNQRLAVEEELHAQAIEREWNAGRARLHGLLLGKVMADSTVHLSGVPVAPLADVLSSLFGGADSCSFDALEATIVLAVFGEPFTVERLRDLRPDREYDAIHTRIRDHLRGGGTLPENYVHLRPHPGSPAFGYVAALVRELAEQASAVNRTPREDLSWLLRSFLTYVSLAAESVRIQVYLHARIQELEGALGAVVPDRAQHHLHSRIESDLCGSATAMLRLRDADPEATLAQIAPTLDRWFRQDALPAVRETLRESPFAAYWFFVQSGATADDQVVFRDSHVRLEPSFTLASLRQLSFDGAIARVRAARIPPDYLQAHALLEKAFTEVVVDPSAVRTAIAHEASDPEERRVLEGLLLGDGASTVTSLDLYASIIKDASRIEGRIDWSRVDEAIGLLLNRKAVRAEAVIELLIDAQRSPDPRLRPYLEASAALMLELERRQALDPEFQQSTAGAAVGWLLSRFFIHGGVPIVLWAPQGVTGPEFTELVDRLTPKNDESGDTYAGRTRSRAALVHDGREYHEALVEIIDESENFLNITSFDWKTDIGGREIAIRLMAKKLGLTPDSFARFLATHERDRRLDESSRDPVSLWDITSTRIKDLLVPFAILESQIPEVVNAREAALAAGASLACDTLDRCGDLSALLEHADDSLDVEAVSPRHAQARRAFQALEALFAERPPSLDGVTPRRAVRDYVDDVGNLRRFVRRYGLRRGDRPDEPFPINIVADSKQTFFNLGWGERSGYPPYLYSDPVRDIYLPLLEFDMRVVLWKGPLEFPWHLGPIPLPGRKIFGIIPMPLIPYPWLNAVPGFGWAGTGTALFLQYLLASDPRVYWGMVAHTKSWSTEATALESGMGMGSKYFNLYAEHRAWHDMGVRVWGDIVGDVNDHFVQVFNEARVNNRGIPNARGVSIPELRYEDYRGPPATGPPSGNGTTWVLTTHPERGDANYRGVLLAAIAAARRNIYLENSFFSGPVVARILLKKARELRGRFACPVDVSSYECAERKREAVQIYLVLPDSSDKPIVDAVGTADVHEMLHLGIKIHRWRPGDGWSASRMLHTKAWLIDYVPGSGGLSYVGAANLTQRSHLADNEAGILTTSPVFADELYRRVFEPDVTVDSRVEEGDAFHTSWSSNPTMRSSRWLRRFLVDLLWFI